MQSGKRVFCSRVSAAFNVNSDNFALAAVFDKRTYLLLVYLIAAPGSLHHVDSTSPSGDRQYSLAQYNLIPASSSSPILPE